METIDTRTMIEAATAAAAQGGSVPRIERRRRLTPIALAVVSEKVRSAYSPIVIAGFVRLSDFLLISLTGIAIYFAYVVRLDVFSWSYVLAILAVAATAVVCFQAADIYDVQVFRGTLRQMTRMISSWAFVFLLFIGASFFAKLGDNISRVWLSGFFLVGLALLIGSRLTLRAMVRHWAREGRLDRRTVIVGADDNGEKLIRALNAQADDSDIRILGVFDDRNDDRAMGTCAGSPKLGKVDDIVEFARRTRVDLVLFALPISAEGRILEMLKKLWVLPVDIRLSAHTNKLRFRPRSYSYLGEVPTLDVFEQPINDWDLVMKSMFDRIVGALALLALSPLLALVAIAIKLDSRGPVFFKQKRFGFNNERIDVFKFRSLRHEMADPTALEARHQGRPARHPRRPLHPQDLDRRTAAADQRRVQGQSVAGRSAPARGAAEAAEPVAGRGGGRLLRPPSRQTGHHRLGADQRLARRGRQRREDPAARRVRPLLHRELVGAVRRLHPAEDAAGAAEDRKRVLVPTIRSD